MILCRKAASGGGDWLGGVAALGRDEVMVKAGSDDSSVGIAKVKMSTTDSSQTCSEPGCGEPDLWIDGGS